MDIRTFSAKIGVSTATVSRAFSGRGVIDPATRERVLSEARLVNFRPNVLAQRLSMQKSGVLGLYYCFSEEPIFDYYNMELAQEIAKAATAAGMGLHLELAPRREPLSENPGSQLAALTAGKAVDGVILVADGRESAGKLLAQISPTPAVVITGEPWGSLACHTQIVIDFEPGIRAAVDHLVSMGHTRIGYLRGQGDAGKLTVLRNALDCHNLKLAAITAELGAKTFVDGQRAFAEWRDRGLTAVVCATDILAFGAIHAAATAKVSLPSEFSIIGMDDLAMAEHSVPALSSIGVPREAIARAAVEALLGALNNAEAEEAPSSCMSVPTYFVERESSGRKSHLLPLKIKKVSQQQTKQKPKP